MRFSLPCDNSFEIPDEWWLTANMRSFKRQLITYPTDPIPEIKIVPLRDIKPLHRDNGIKLDFGGFSRDRIIKIFNGFMYGNTIPPIEVFKKKEDIFLYELHNGFHRFYASIAAGFESIPALVLEDWR